MFNLIPNFKSRIADFNVESDFSLPHPQGVLGQGLTSVTSVANLNKDMSVQIMTMMKLNYDQRAVQCIILLCYVPRSIFYNGLLLKKVMLNLLEENDNNHRRSMCFKH